MADPGWAVQTAVYGLLSAGLSCPVYDHVPEDSAYPYVVIDRTVVGTDDTFSTRRDERFVTLSVWSQYRGQKEVVDIIAEIDTALHNQRPTLTNGRVVQMRIDRRDTNREPDGLTYMGQVSVRIVTEH